MLRNDLYALPLSAEDANGRMASTTIVGRVSGQMKVGHLSFTLQDLTLPVVGLPITIHRTYDSRDTAVGDFGIGWRLDVQSVTVRKNRILRTGWQQGKVNTLTYCVAPDGAHYVTITLPDGRVGAFDLAVTIYDPTMTRVVVDKAVARLRLHCELSCLKAREEADGHLTQLLGDSAPRRALRQQMARLVTLGVTESGDAPTVLIHGETGTGTA